MSAPADDGWNASAAAWIADMGERGDWSREFVLDPAMLARVRGRSFRTALDVGCGEGRFCRALQALGIATTGVDPTHALIARVRERDPGGRYIESTAEAMDVAAGAFDLTVAYLSLIDIPDYALAIAKMTAALRPGGTLLVANLNSFTTASPNDGWDRTNPAKPRFYIDHYLDERAGRAEWRGISIVNWHRPFGAYVAEFLRNGLLLRYFAEPEPQGADPAVAARYRRVPFFHVMEWEKPEA